VRQESGGNVLKIAAISVVILLVSVQAWATPFWMVNGGSNGTTEKSSIGVEVGGTNAILNRFPLSAEMSMNFDFQDIPSDTHFNTNKHDEPYTVKKVSDGPEFGYLFKSGVNLDDWVKNLTLQVGAGYALQSKIRIATGSVSGKHWQEGRRDIDASPVGYGGVMYRVQNICLSVGYNNRRGVVTGIGSTW
jgi:hypothetical protein